MCFLGDRLSGVVFFFLTLWLCGLRFLALKIVQPGIFETRQVASRYWSNNRNQDKAEDVDRLCNCCLLRFLLKLLGKLPISSDCAMRGSRAPLRAPLRRRSCLMVIAIALVWVGISRSQGFAGIHTYIHAYIHLLFLLFRARSRVRRGPLACKTKKI